MTDIDNVIQTLTECGAKLEWLGGCLNPPLLAVRECESMVKRSVASLSFMVDGMSPNEQLRARNEWLERTAGELREQIRLMRQDVQGANF